MAGARYRLPRTQRLSGAARYTEIMKTGTRVRDANFAVFALVNDRDHPRLGLMVARHALRLATERNRVRRQIRESFRQTQEKLRGLDVVVRAHAATATAHNRDLRASLERHWQNIASRCGPSSSS